MRLRLNQAGHQGHDVGLRNGLAVADRQRTVGVSAIAKFVGYKFIARRLPQRFRYPLLKFRHTGKPMRVADFRTDFIQQAIPFHRVGDFHAALFRERGET